jgi:hypothetical protein
MARTMLDEYKTSYLFWDDAVKNACHDINRLYLHKKLNKTSYEILTGNKPKVSYFRVFGCKCFILNKRPKSSKFASKVDEGILIGYGSNEHAYRVFNKTLGRIEVTVDVTFDESNGSQVEQIDSSVVGKEDPPCKAIKQRATGDVRPQENQDSDDEGPQATTAPISTDKLVRRCSTHLLEISSAVVPRLGAVVPHPTPQQQLLQILLHQFKGST